MPQYEIHHSCPLQQNQQDALASAFTKLHCALFSAPSIFVNVTFHLANDSTPIYVGGKRSQTNYVIGHLRPRGPENAPKLKRLVEEITKIWNHEARPNLGGSGGAEKVEEGAPGRLDDPRALHNIFIMEDIVAGAEQGFILPVAGQDGKWVEENMNAFEKRSQQGDESMRKLVEEVKHGLGK